MTAMTETTFRDFARSIREAAENYYDKDAYDEARLATFDRLNLFLYTGEPVGYPEGFDEDLAEDYVCALDDGRIVAWGSEHPIPGASRTWRELVIVDRPTV